MNVDKSPAVEVRKNTFQQSQDLWISQYQNCAAVFDNWTDSMVDNLTESFLLDVTTKADNNEFGKKYEDMLVLGLAITAVMLICFCYPLGKEMNRLFSSMPEQGEELPSYYMRRDMKKKRKNLIRMLSSENI